MDAVAEKIEKWPIPSSTDPSVPLYHQTPPPFTFVATPDGTDSALWQDWLDQHGEVFLLFARQQTRCEADARDVFQEALIDSWRRSGSQPPDRALVFAQIRRRAIDLARSIDRRVRREQETLRETDAPWFTVDFSAGDTGDFLARAIAGLPPALAEVLTLKIWGDLSFPEMSRLLGIPAPTAASRYHAALDRLRPCLTQLQP
jgi:RNA polymerase sigma-70 factor (ECF subfamily)